MRKARPDIAISGDFIVGFPGETEEDYLDTLAIVAEVGYSTAYSFAYSPRPGTPGEAMPNQVDQVVKKERLAGLQALLDEQQHDFNRRFEGKTVNVLVEEANPKKPGQLKGRNEHNLVVNFDGNERLIGQMMPVNITHAGPRSMVGEIKLPDMES